MADIELKETDTQSVALPEEELDISSSAQIHIDWTRDHEQILLSLIHI